MDKSSIIKNFSKAAQFYDKYADIQRLAAAELLCRVSEEDFQSILEIGCGTGIYTNLLAERFKKALLNAVDISPGMIKVAREKLSGKSVEFMVADAEKVLPEGRFDLLTSNACFQWFRDPAKALLKYRDILVKGGIFSFSIFGPETFWELGVVLGKVFKDKPVAASRFMAKEGLQGLLDGYFNSVVIDEKRYCEKFLNLTDFLNKIKFTGTSGAENREKIFLGPKRLAELEEVYKHNFGEIKATYQIFFCRCTRP